jgi:hypothetical protein
MITIRQHPRFRIYVAVQKVIGYEYPVIAKLLIKAYSVFNRSLAALAYR